MPKLVQINVSLNKASTGRIAEWIATTAQKRGWDCYMVHGARYMNPSKFKSIQVSSIDEERCHYMKSLLFDAQGLGSKMATRRLISKLYEIKPDVVHLHNLHGCFINYPLLFEFLTKEKIPVVWTLHDCWPFTGHCVYFDMVNCEKWQTGCDSCIQKRKFPQSLIVDKSKRNWNLKRTLFNSVDNMVLAPVSEWLGGFVKKSFLKEHPIEVIHNGIDLNVFKPVADDIRKIYNAERKYLILGVADGFGERKGFDDFVKLASLLGNKYQIILIGVEERKQVPNLSNVKILSRTNSQQELVEFYSAADVFVNPTYEDNFPTTNLEALACGTPVITYNTGGSPEAIDETTGIVVEKGNLSALTDAIRRLQDMPIDATACRQRAKTYYDKEICFERYVDIYDKMINNKNNSIMI